MNIEPRARVLARSSTQIDTETRLLSSIIGCRRDRLIDRSG